MRRKRRSFRRVFMIGVLALAALVYSGALEPEQEVVEDVHIVMQGDTVWNIAETYIDKNTGGRRHMLEFMEGIFELNPWIRSQQGGNIYPGQIVRVNYFVRKG